MRTTGLLCGFLIAGATGAPTTARAGNWNTELFPSRPDYVSAGNLSLLGGVRVLDEDDWAPVDKPLQFGLDFDYTKRA